MVKIGWTTDMKTCLNVLQVANPFELTVEILIPVDDGPLIEKELHAKLDTVRIRGDWFTMSVDDVSQLFF